MMEPTLPLQVKQQFKLLVTKYPLLTENSIGTCYSRMFNKNLDPQVFGHSSLNSLFCSLATSKIVHMSYENCAVTIKPTKETLAEMTQNVYTQEACDLTQLEVRSDKMKEVPSDSVEKGKFGPSDDCIYSQHHLPEVKLSPRLIEGETFPIVLTQVESPSLFWFNLYSDENFEQLKKVMDKMDEFYGGIEGDKYRINNTSEVDKFTVLAATYKKTGFHRAFVVKILSLESLKLFYVDFGTSDVQKLKHCRFLHKQFATLPAQAIKARLWGVKPFGGERHWRRDNKARDMILDLVELASDGSLIAQIKAGVHCKEVTVKGDDELEEDRGLALSLLDIYGGDNGLDIATQLVTERLAEWELWDINKEDVYENETGSKCKVVKYSQPKKSSKPGGRLTEDGAHHNDKVKVNSKLFEESSSSIYVELLKTHCDNVRRLHKLLDEVEPTGTSNDARAQERLKRECEVDLLLERVKKLEASKKYK